jgi:CxxC motif-containing protein (DUF1111 family)
MPQLRRLLSALPLALAATACQRAPEPVATTAVEAGEPLPGLTEEQRGRFLLGKALFTRLTAPEEGLGPTFNQTRCSACHELPEVGGSGTTDGTLGKARLWENGTCDLLEDEGGDLIQKEATPALLATGYTPPEQTPPSASVRIDEPALAIFGMGLVEIIPEAEILSREDPDDADGDGISGRAGRDISGHPGMEGQLGRFTRKAEWARLYDFIDAALRTELGLTTPRAPEEQTLNGAPVPPEADPAPDPEMDEEAMDLLYDFIRFLAPPPPETITSGAVQDSVDRGRELFDEVQCAVCHTPTMSTGAAEIPAMANQTLDLYSDLLLHDLGEENSGMCGPYATPAEYRTSLLWGLRFKANFMHDGAATTLRRSIELHGGESEASRDAFDALSAEEQAYLLRFLESL